MIKDYKKEIEYELMHIDSEKYLIFLFIYLFMFTYIYVLNINVR